MTDHQNHQKRSIADHTTTCPYCGHRCLPANLKGHVERIHPEKAGEETFLGHLERTQSDSWWRRHQPQRETPVSPSFLAPVEVDAPRQKKRGGEPARDYSDYLMCRYCARWMPQDEMDQHLSKHRVNEPFRSPDEVHCPVCGLNERLVFIGQHLHHLHPTYAKKQRNLFIQAETERVNQLKAGQPQGHPTSANASTKKETTPPWVLQHGSVHCPICNKSVKAEAFYGHLARIHSNRMAIQFKDHWVKPASINAVYAGRSAIICCPACGDNVDHLLFFSHVQDKHIETFFPNRS